MMNKTIPVCALLCVAGTTMAFAQTPGSCVTGTAEAFLEAGDARVRLRNNGMIGWPGSAPHYEAPKGSGVNAMSCTATWIGGYVEGELRLAATTAGPFEFWPGPLDDDGNPPTDCTPYDRLYEITREDIERYNNTGVVSENLHDWPWHLGAPVLDGDGIAGNYDVAWGDRPALVGDQMFWWIMNDVGNVHERTGTKPIGLEIHATAHAFRAPNSYVSNATFYRYTLIYKGQAPLEDAFLSLHPEPDLGVYDNLVGSDTTLHLGYVYNGDNDDEQADGGYGLNPPALGLTFLQGPLAQRDAEGPEERLGMTRFIHYFGGGGSAGSPYKPEHYYNYMQGRWRDGKPLTYGGKGLNFSKDPARFAYPGDPVKHEFWSMMNLDDAGTSLWPHDHVFVMSTGPFTMQPGDTQEIAFAIALSQGADHLDSVTQLKQDVAQLQDHADVFLSPDPRILTIPPAIPKPPNPLGFAQNYPNPFTTATVIRYSLPEPMHVRLTVFDVLGRQRAALVNEWQEGGIYEIPFEPNALPGGVYFYRIEMDHLAFTHRMTLIR